MYMYKKDIIDELKKKGYTSYVIKNKKLLSQSTLQKIKRGDNLTIQSLNDICIMLKCNISDIVDIVPTDDEKIKFY